MSDASDIKEENKPAVASAAPVAVNLPTPAQSDDQFIAEFANMDLDPLRDKTYMVSINTGDRNKGKFLSTVCHGPYDFLEMVEEVGFMWEKFQHHAKVIVLERDRSKAVQFLDHKTTDYLEAHYLNIVAEGILENAIAGGNEPFTHTATILSAKPEDDPRKLDEVPALAPPPSAVAPTAPVDPEDEDL